MLRLTLPAIELWDELNQEFIYAKELTLQLEHSLVSLSKWESRWHKPFLHTPLNFEQTLDYVRCMTLTQNVSPETYYRLTDAHIEQIRAYIEDPMTATTFREEKASKRNHEIITAEIIYYWMSTMQIPIDCQKWHLNRLLTLIRVCSLKNAPAKKMSKRETISQYAALNEARKKQLNTKG